MKAHAKEKLNKVLKWKPLYMILAICIVITSCFVLNPDETVYAATCPEKGDEDWKYEYMTGCSPCGGTKEEFGEWERIGDESGFDGVRYNGPDGHDSAGSGILVDKSTTWTSPVTGKTYNGVDVVYRCYNCGYISYDGTIYNKNTYRCWENTICVKFPNGTICEYGPQSEEDGNNGKGEGPGAVPWYYCGFCDGLSAGNYSHKTCYTIKVNVSLADAGTVSFSHASIGTVSDAYGIAFQDGNGTDRVKIITESGSQIEAIMGPKAEIDINVEVNDGYEFLGWSNGSKDTTIRVTATKDMTYTASIGAPSRAVEIVYQTEDGTILGTAEDTVILGKPYKYTADNTINIDDETYEFVSSSYKMGSVEKEVNSTTISISECTDNVTMTFVFKEMEHKCTFEWGDSNETHHWYICTECGATSTKHAHNLVKVEETDEFITYECQCNSHPECDYSETENVIPEVHECVYGDWIYVDHDNGHWKECIECGAIGEEGSHSEVSSGSDGDGNAEYTCTDCGHTCTRHKHQYSSYEEFLDIVTYYIDYDSKSSIDYDWEFFDYWEGGYDKSKWDPAKYHWKVCMYDSCSKFASKGSHSAGSWVDEGEGYKVKRCTKCSLVMDKEPITIQEIILDPNGGTFPDGSTEPKSIGPFVYGEVSDFYTLGTEYFPEMEGKDFFGFFVVESSGSECFYEPVWDNKTLISSSRFFGSNANGTKYSKVTKQYTLYAQYRASSYTVEYHPVSKLANPQTMISSYHDVGESKQLNQVGFYVTIPITYSTGTEAGTVETTADNTSHVAKFLGWAISEEAAKAGSYTYEDKATVLDLLKHAGTYHLYACWDYGTIILPNAISANGGSKLSGWIDSDGNFYSVLDESGNYTTTNTYQLSDRQESFTAVWVPNTYKVTFDSRGGSDCDPITVTYNKAYNYGNSGLPTPTREGYTFVEWVNLLTTQTVKNSTIVTTAADHTLVAVWKANPITVTLEYCFDYNGTAKNPQKNSSLKAVDADTDTYSTYYNEYYDSLTTPSMDGYAFSGWYLEKGADGQGCGHTQCLVSNTIRIQTASNHTVYAKWVKDQYKIYLDDNQGYSVWEEE